MFCPKCGKEIGEGLRFCGACGFDTAAVQQAVAAPQQTEQGQQATAQGQQATAQEQQTAQGQQTAQAQQAAQGQQAAQEQQATQGQQATNTLSPEQTAKFQAAYAEAESNLVKLENQSNTLALIGKIILVVTEAILLFKVIPNEKNFIGVLAVAVFGLIPFYCYVYFVRAGISIKKRKVVGSYVDALTGRSLKEIADMWKTSACPDIKDVNYNPYQNIVTIHSKLWGEAEVKQQEGHTTLTWLKGKDNGFAQSTLAAYLVKQINPTLKLDARKVYKNNKFWKHTEWICGWLIFGAFMIAFGMMIMGAFGGQQYIGAVKDSAPDGYNITYGEAFDKVFEKGEWEYFETDDKMMIVDYTGTKNGRKIQLQWKLTPKDKGLVEYELYAAEVDGEPVTRLEAGLLLLAIMEGTSLEDELSGYGSLFDSNQVVGSTQNSQDNSSYQSSSRNDEIPAGSLVSESEVDTAFNDQYWSGYYMGEYEQISLSMYSSPELGSNEVGNITIYSADGMKVLEVATLYKLEDDSYFFFNPSDEICQIQMNENNRGDVTMLYIESSGWTDELNLDYFYES